MLTYIVYINVTQTRTRAVLMETVILMQYIIIHHAGLFNTYVYASNELRYAVNVHKLMYIKQIDFDHL